MSLWTGGRIRAGLPGCMKGHEGGLKADCRGAVVATEFKVAVAPRSTYIPGAMYRRALQPAPSKSWFLFGPRQTGKSTLVRSLLGPHDLYVDLLHQRTFLDYAKNP